MDKHTSVNKLHQLLLKGKKRTFSKSQVFQYSTKSQELYYLDTGYVKRYTITSRGSLGVQIIYGPGDIFPLTHTFSLLANLNINKQQETYYYEAMCTTDLYGVDNDTLQAAVSQDNDLYKDLFREAGRRLESNIQQLENLSLQASHKRVAHLLHVLARKFGESAGNGVRVLAPVTQQDLADMLGMSRETISMAVSKLRELGLIDSARSYTVTSMTALHDEAIG